MILAGGRLMRLGRIQSDNPPAHQKICSTVPQDGTKLSTAYFDAHNPFWSFPGIYIESSRSWRSISAEIVSRAVGKVVWLSDCYRIVYALSDFLGTVRNDNGPEHESPLMHDNFSFCPFGIALESTVEAPVRYIQIVQRREVYDSIVSEMVRGGAVNLRPRTKLHDPLVSQIALTIATQIDHGVLDTILADALSTALAVRIVRHYVDPSAIELASSSGLSRERLQRVRDYIEAQLDGRLSLADLAGVACLSPYHFSRSFKLALGVGPQRYVMQRRLERAKTLMRRTNQPLAWIAQEAGFSDQSHLTSVFRREAGVTPGRFRAAMA
jgi:AraC family transcriptional regulator